MNYKPLLFPLFVWMSSQAQDFKPVKMEQIKKMITDSDPASNYEKLMNRFNAFDTTLTLAQYQLLYYGYVFQHGYSAYPNEKKGEIINALNEKNYSGAVLLCDTVLAGYPISLTANFYKSYALFNQFPGESVYIKYRDRFTKLAGSIIASGDGLKCETGFKVISVSDEYLIIYNYFNIDQFKGQSLVGHCDKLTVKPSPQWLTKDIYFDATEVLKKEAELFHK